MDLGHFTTNTIILCTAGSAQLSTRADVCSNTSRNRLRDSTNSKLTHALSGARLPSRSLLWVVLGKYETVAWCYLVVAAIFWWKNGKLTHKNILARLRADSIQPATGAYPLLRPLRSSRNAPNRTKTAYERKKWMTRTWSTWCWNKI